MGETSDKYFSTEEIIRGCSKNERYWQEMLYTRFAPKMFGICLRYTNDYHAAEDILQEGFIRVFKNIANFRGDGSFEGWLRRIFVNSSIESFRKTVHLYPIIDDENKEIDIPDTSITSNLEENDLLKMIQELSPGYRTIFNLYAVEGYSHKEIAKMLGINEGTSKSQLARARAILQAKIEAAGYVRRPASIG